MTYTFVGHHPDTLANGRPLAFGDPVRLRKAEVVANERLIRSGLLIAAQTPAAPAQPTGAPAPQSHSEEE